VAVLAGTDGDRLAGALQPARRHPLAAGPARHGAVRSGRPGRRRGRPHGDGPPHPRGGCSGPVTNRADRPGRPAGRSAGG
jgi:hypothetical protein